MLIKERVVYFFSWFLFLLTECDRKRLAKMDVQLVSAANNKFALDLFKILYDGNQNQNTFVSPFSISVALAMTHLGAREETAQGMAKALRWETDDEAKLHEQFQAYVTQLQTPNDQYQLSTANRIYIEKSYAVLDEFKNKTKKCYLAEAVSSNFVSDADNERLQINSWVSEQTKNKINDLLAPGVLDALTRMVLVNAIYFKGNWDKQFEVENTKPKPFKVAPGQTKDVPMMTMTHNFPYIVDEELKCTALEIPYKGRELGMVIILPDEDFGLQTLVNSLTSEKLDDLLSQVRGPRGKVNFSFPKFEVTSSFQLKDPLSKLGMAHAFDASKANFSGISGVNNLAVSAVVHKAFVKVNEEGTEAAAATAVTVMLCSSSISMKLPVVTVDHPFLFVIRDHRANGNILFLGQVSDPDLKQ
ncbi:leukocyte elastase inhibitor-like isoform X1 [Physella acuta]|uniref:leukocyte elastase inhibitor-like isoform X1 n=2 Tax=Physella acuta TaxID=109671 RepID=UPI0027DD058D|nr:leukocyte elastase inhibitor-like isoform X1 [Physella acuta]